MTVPSRAPGQCTYCGNFAHDGRVIGKLERASRPAEIVVAHDGCDAERRMEDEVRAKYGLEGR